MELSREQISNLIKEDPKELLNFLVKINIYLNKLLISKINNEKDREEIVADIIISVLDSLPNFKFKSKFSTWVYSIARHEIIDYYRKQKIKNIIFSKFPFLEYIADKALGPELMYEEKELKHKIFKTFKNISEGYSNILRLKYLEDFSVKEIASELGITYKAAESKLSRARLAFRTEYSLS